jgi:hypothetical protein
MNPVVLACLCGFERLCGAPGLSKPSVLSSTQCIGDAGESLCVRKQQGSGPVVGVMAIGL